jgi:hypothetical protein
LAANVSTVFARDEPVGPVRIDAVFAAAAPHGLGPAVARVDAVVAGAAREAVVAGAAVEPVVPRPALDAIGTRSGADAVGAAGSPHDVVPAQCDDHIGARRVSQDIASRRAHCSRVRAETTMRSRG